MKDGPPPGSSKTPKEPPASDPRRDGLGEALKSVYGDTLREDIPADLLALLGKLD